MVHTLPMLRRFLIGLVIVALLGGATLTYWIASPPESDRSLPAPLEPWIPHAEMPSSYDTDLASLTRAFRPQAFRSFCGPSSMATVLRAYGKDADQKTVVRSILERLQVFYSGMSLAELGSLAQDNGLQARVVYADSIDVDQFRELLKTNLGHTGDFVLIKLRSQGPQAVGIRSHLADRRLRLVPRCVPRSRRGGLPISIHLGSGAASLCCRTHPC